nr:hypothetical protein [Tanacetum cinerariifolium]
MDPRIKFYEKYVYSTDIITVDQGHCEKWGMKLTKEVANQRCLSYSIYSPTVFSLSIRTRQRVLTFEGPRQEVVTKKNTHILEKMFSGPRSVVANSACSKEMISYRSEVEEAVRTISSTYSSKPLLRNYKAKNSPYGSRISKGIEKRLGNRGGGCWEVSGGGGGAGVVSGVRVVCGDGVDSGVGGVDCGVIYGLVCGGVC